MSNGKNDWEDFFYKYFPEKNPKGDDSFDGHMFETYGEDYEVVCAQNEHFVWTIIDSDSDDNFYMIPGRHLVNRIGYLIATVPWEDENEEYTT